MKKAKLFYNPGAGNCSYQAGDLLSILESNGYNSEWVSTKENNWDQLEEDIDLIVIAGGDGTVRKVCTFLLKEKMGNIPIGLLPLGTANNIASSLKIVANPADIVKRWNSESVQLFDVGKVRIGESTNYFFESFGCGFFPYFFRKADKEKLPESQTPAQSIFHALKVMEQLLPGSDIFQHKIIADENDLSGNYFLVELMLVQHAGPGITLAPHSELNDGVFDLVLLNAKQKDSFATYISDKLNEKKSHDEFPAGKVKKLTIRSSSRLIHIDDEVLDMAPGTEMKIKILPEALRFLKY